MKLFGKRSQSSDSSNTVKDVIELVESENEEYDDDTNSEQVFTCSDCGVSTSLSEIKRNLYVCPNCGKHAKISARRRVKNIADEGTFKKIKSSTPFKNPLNFPGYDEKIKGLQKKTGLDEGILSGVCKIEGHKTVLAVMASEFLMGSMGVAVGEMVTRTFEYADKMNLPVIIFTASGGARMQATPNWWNS